MKKEKVPAEFPPASITTARLKKLKTFHRYLVESALEKGMDYNVQTMSLKKPGAEKIAFIMRLSADYELLDVGSQFDTSFLCIRKVKCVLQDSTGRRVAVGLGECNSAEKKNTNTVLKIAKKRSYVDAVISASFTGRIFTQDMEDEPKAAKAEPAASAPPPAQPESVSTVEPPVYGREPGDETEVESGPNIFTQTTDEPEKPDEAEKPATRPKGGVRYITHRQVNYLFAEARDHKKEPQEVTGALSTLGLKSPNEIPFYKFDLWLSWARGELSIFDLSHEMGQP